MRIPKWRPQPLFSSECAHERVVGAADGGFLRRGPRVAVHSGEVRRSGGGPLPDDWSLWRGGIGATVLASRRGRVRGADRHHPRPNGGHMWGDAGGCGAKTGVHLVLIHLGYLAGEGHGGGEGPIADRLGAVLSGVWTQEGSDDEVCGLKPSVGVLGD